MSGINLCQINLYLTGLYGVRKKYMGFQYGTKFAEKTVSFLYTSEFGGWANELRSREGPVFTFDMVGCSEWE